MTLLGVASNVKTLGLTRMDVARLGCLLTLCLFNIVSMIRLQWLAEVCCDKVKFE